MKQHTKISEYSQRVIDNVPTLHSKADNYLFQSGDAINENKGKQCGVLKDFAVRRSSTLARRQEAVHRGVQPGT